MVTNNNPMRQLTVTIKLDITDIEISETEDNTLTMDIPVEEMSDTVRDAIQHTSAIVQDRVL